MENEKQDDNITMKRVLKLTKHYARKVNLSGVSSRYDNIEIGTYISIPVEYKDEAEFNAKSKIIGQKVFQETERDIALAVGSLIKMSQEQDNSVLLGMGDNDDQVQTKSFIESQIDGFEDVQSEQQIMPEGYTEVDF